MKVKVFIFKDLVDSQEFLIAIKKAVHPIKEHLVWYLFGIVDCKQKGKQVKVMIQVYRARI